MNYWDKIQSINRVLFEELFHLKVAHYINNHYTFYVIFWTILKFPVLSIKSSHFSWLRNIISMLHPPSWKPRISSVISPNCLLYQVVVKLLKMTYPFAHCVTKAYCIVAGLCFFRLPENLQNAKCKNIKKPRTVKNSEFYSKTLVSSKCNAHQYL